MVRYTPSSSPAVKVFGRSPGYVIDKRHTNGTLVAFHQIDFGAAGQWKCRVTAEAPSFESVEASARLRVVGEVLRYVWTRLWIGVDYLTNCTSAHVCTLG